MRLFNLLARRLARKRHVTATPKPKMSAITPKDIKDVRNTKTPYTKEILSIRHKPESSLIKKTPIVKNRFDGGSSLIPIKKNKNWFEGKSPIINNMLKNMNSKQPFSLFLFFLFLLSLTNQAVAETQEEDNKDDDENLGNLNSEEKEKLKQLILEGTDKIQAAKDKDIILVIGKTGAGKSLLINYLLGYDMEDKETSLGSVVQGKNIVPAKIGFTTASETLHPGVYETENRRFVFVDCPGFFENREKFNKVWTEVSMHLAIERSKSVRGVIVVLDINTVRNRGAVEKYRSELEKISSKLGLFFDPQRVAAPEFTDSVLLVITKNEDSNRPLTKTNICNVLDAHVVEIKKKITAIERKYPQNLAEKARAFIERYVNEMSEETQLGEEIQSEIKSEITKEDAKELRELQARLTSMEFLERLSKKNMVITNVMKNETRNEILDNRLMELKPIPQKQEAIIFNRHSWKFNQLREVMVDTANDGINHLLKQRQLLKDIGEAGTEINSLSTQKNTLDKERINSDNSDININLRLLDIYRAERKEAQAKINDIQTQIQEIEKTKNEEVLQSSIPFYEERNIFGILSWSEKELSYNDLSFCKIKRTKLTNRQEIIPDNYFSDEDKKPEKGLYKVKYKTPFYRNGDVNIEVYVKRELTTEYKNTRKQLTNKLHAKQTKLNDINDKIAPMESLKTREDSIKHCELKIALLKEKLIKLNEETGTATEDLEAKFDLYVSIKELSHILDLDKDPRSNFLSKFSTDLNNTYTQHAQQLQKIAEQKQDQRVEYLGKSLNRYEQALKYDKNNFSAILGSAEILTELNPEEAKKYYKKTLSLPDFKKLDSSKKQKIAKQNTENDRLIPLHDKLNWHILNPTIYSSMSELAYFDNTQQIQQNTDAQILYKSLQGRGWKISGASNKLNCDDYFGLVFQHEKKKQLVIAHRGTTLKLGSIIADSQLVSAELPKQFSHGAALFTNDMVSRYPNYRITHTGHSLGGSLAILSAYKFKTNATAFDPYGVQKIISSQFRDDKIMRNPKSFQVTSYLSAPNLVNTASSHVGLVFQVFPNTQPRSWATISEDTAKNFLKMWTNNDLTHRSTEIVDDIVKFHSMSNIRASFSETTGMPLQSRIVNSWINSPVDYVSWLAETSKDPNTRIFLDLNALSPDRKSIIKGTLNYDTENYNNQVINLSYLSEHVQESLKKNPRLLPNDLDIVLSHCEIKDNNLVVIDNSMTALQIKYFLEENSSLINSINKRSGSSNRLKPSDIKPTQLKAGISASQQSSNLRKDGIGMRSTFHDMSNTDYDNLIRETNEAMQESDSCEKVDKLDSLIKNLKNTESTYFPRPCFEGFCLGFFIPHREKIRGRVATLSEEKKIYEQECGVKSGI